ncbi:hypothetical protein M409DRAFT_29505 [Zasmidium cellare ATCC 36951]|uniref:Uncharacterized protein n=1 Tax=Zasmidium cellare ATCC 36951 TaxID=1080233 RepID=A0A6A6BZB2_ZASCE|nr:uncharacterized protein M409DRAFT_29505 [Zasmidium cellare ATCC 36951]KAF2160055.1 hypothetical protein M409DRAFT_29505 [Zasmidium cellare ATCC 36951]
MAPSSSNPPPHRNNEQAKSVTYAPEIRDLDDVDALLDRMDAMSLSPRPKASRSKDAYHSNAGMSDLAAAKPSPENEGGQRSALDPNEAYLKTTGKTFNFTTPMSQRTSPGEMRSPPLSPKPTLKLEEQGSALGEEGGEKKKMLPEEDWVSPEKPTLAAVSAIEKASAPSHGDDGVSKWTYSFSRPESSPAALPGKFPHHERSATRKSEISRIGGAQLPQTPTQEDLLHKTQTFSKPHHVWRPVESEEKIPLTSDPDRQLFYHTGVDKFGKPEEKDPFKAEQDDRQVHPPRPKSHSPPLPYPNLPPSSPAKDPLPALLRPKRPWERSADAYGSVSPVQDVKTAQKEAAQVEGRGQTSQALGVEGKQLEASKGEETKTEEGEEDGQPIPNVFQKIGSAFSGSPNN